MGATCNFSSGWLRHDTQVLFRCSMGLGLPPLNFRAALSALVFFHNDSVSPVNRLNYSLIPTLLSSAFDK